MQQTLDQQSIAIHLKLNLSTVLEQTQDLWRQVLSQFYRLNTYLPIALPIGVMDPPYKTRAGGGALLADFEVLHNGVVLERRRGVVRAAL